MTAEFIQHRSPQANRRAKAPYNFVPLPEKVLTVEEEFAAHDKFDSERHTGYIELEIKTETPLYTRCAYPASIYSDSRYVDENGELTSEFSDKDKPKTTAIAELQQFFHRGDKNVPVIPGSTLRGMTRSLVEILAYGKMNFVTDAQLVHRAVADVSSLGRKYREQLLGKDKGHKHFDYPSSNLKGGYLETRNSKYYIRPAIENNNESFVHIEIDDLNEIGSLTDNIVYVEKSTIRTTEYRRGEQMDITLDIAVAENISNVTKANYLPAKLVKTNVIGRKHMQCAIFGADSDDTKLIPISDKMWKIFKDDRDMKRGIPCRKIQNQDDALFYLLDDSSDLVFFGSTMMFRLPYTNTIEKFIPEILRCHNKLDIADVIFGSVQKKQIAGRVFFSDAVCTTESPYLGGANNGRRVPKILSSPKPTSFQLYLSQPTPNHKDDLKSYYDVDETVIRGSKRYWHKTTLEGDDVFDRNQERNIANVSSQHTIINPVRPNVTFGKAKVYFENLTAIELGAVLTALDLEETMRHQIGMAKPYGLGSIEIEPTLVLQDRENRYKSLFYVNNTWSNPTKTNSEDFKTLFKEKILNHYNDLVSQSSKVEEFWRIPRIQALATMLEWTNAEPSEEKEYADFRHDRNIFTQRHVLPFPQMVENNPEPNQIQINDPNLWAAKCVENVENDSDDPIEGDSENSSFIIEFTPTVSLLLIHLPSKNVPGELNKFYLEWKEIYDESLKIEMAKVIVEKGKTWKNAKKKTWFQEVVAFVEESK